MIIASLGTIFLDILHWELLSGPNGLPLGLLFSKQRFSEVQYLISPDFRFGLLGLSPWYKLLAFGLFIIISTLMPVFAGPAAALLLIPENHDDWPAGGASLWLAVNDDDLWPSRLTSAATGGPHCASPTPQNLTSEALSFVDCVWAGLSPLAEILKQAHDTVVDDLTIDDGILRRQFGLAERGISPETWVTAVHMAVGIFSRNAGQVWFQALLNVPFGSRFHTLRWRNQGGTSASIQKWTPVVRTTCNVVNAFFSNSTTLQSVSIIFHGRLL